MTHMPERPPPEMPRPAAVYRPFSACGELLYIGSAYNPEARCKAHRKASWWSQVARREDQWMQTRQRAYEGELKAIAAERPRHNSMGTPAYSDACRKRAREDSRRQAIIRAGSAAGRGAPREIVDAILRREIKSYTKNGPVPF